MLPSLLARSSKALFARVSREDDYRVAWAYFEATGQSGSVR